MSDESPAFPHRLRKPLTPGLAHSRRFLPLLQARWSGRYFNPLGISVLGAAASLACGLFLHPHGYVLFAGIGAVLAVGLFWPWVCLKGMEGELAFSRSPIEEDEEIEVRLTLRNRHWWPVLGLSLRGRFGTEEDAAFRSVAAVPARRLAAFRFALPKLARGRHPRGRTHLATGFPFGILESNKDLAIRDALLVRPRIYPVGPPPSAALPLTEGTTAQRKVGVFGDVLGLRPYRRGDSLRRIHWGQSARHDRLIVCELENLARPVFLLMLDGDPAIHTAGRQGTLEWSMRILASLATGWLRGGAAVGIQLPGRDISPASGIHQMNRMLDALAEWSPPEEATAEGFTSSVGSLPEQACPVVVTTDRRSERWEARDSHEPARYVVLRTAGFPNGDEAPLRSERPIDSPLRHAWLMVENPDDVPGKLLAGWQEARHGS